MTGAVGQMQMDSPGAPLNQTYNGGSFTLKSDGTITGSGTPPASWNSQGASPTIGGRYWVRLTKTGGVGTLTPTSGTWVSLVSDQICTNTGVAGAANGTIDFATDAAGSNIVVSNTFSVNNTL